jgi:hypothetical protein
MRVLVTASAKLGWLVTSLALLGSSGPIRSYRSFIGAAHAEYVSARFVAVVDITPDSANSARFGIEQQGQQLSASGNHKQAAELYWQKGVELKDPVLIVDAGESWREQARSQRSIEAAQTAIVQASVALDMLYFLRDGATSSAWQPVAPEHLGTLIERAQTVVSDAQALIAEIEAEQRRATEAVNAPVEEPRERGPAKPGTGLIVGGSAALVIGLGSAGLAAAGLVLGAQAQTDVEDPLVYEPEHSDAQARGRSANLLAGIGIGVGAVGVSVGIALIATGVKKRKQAGPTTAVVLPMPMIGPDGGGLGFVGRF